MTQTDVAPVPDSAAVARAAATTHRRSGVHAVGLLWRREMMRLRRNPIRVAMGLVTPLMFLIVLGTGLDAASEAQMEGFRGYLFPGVLVMAVQAPAISVGISLVWDRRMGALRQMLASPLPRSSIVLGLAIGGATVGGVYGLMVLATAGAADVPYSPMLLLVLAETTLVALLFTAIGLLAAVTIRSVETFQVVVSLSLMPLMFFSGAMFPPEGLPGWLGFFVKANPLTYAVDAVRRTLPGDPASGELRTKLTLFDWTPPVMVELGFLAAIAAAVLTVVCRRFSRAE